MRVSHVNIKQLIKRKSLLRPVRKAHTAMVIATTLLICTSILAPTQALAMGSGDKFSDAQTGLTYAVHKPSQTFGLPLHTFKLLVCSQQQEQWLYAQYGTAKKSIEIMETMAGVKCSNPGLSKQAPSISINNRPAKVYIYCDPTTPATYKKCTTKDIARVGGYLIFTTKPTKTLKATEIQVQGTGGITYAQLIAVAKSLKALS